MAIENIRITVSDVARAVTFYGTLLEAVPVGRRTSDRAVVDVVTATLEFIRAPVTAPSTWEANDLQRGFRHIGFKVADIDLVAARIKNSGVPFRADPFEADGGVRIAFFFDPDGTQIELVERDLEYQTVVSDELLAAERALGVPRRPRFDHVAITVDDLTATANHYRLLNFDHLGTIAQEDDPRGFRLDYFKSGDTVLEVFTFTAETRPRDPQPSTPGFSSLHLNGSAPTDPESNSTLLNGMPAQLDPDGVLYTVTETS